MAKNRELVVRFDSGRYWDKTEHQFMIGEVSNRDGRFKVIGNVDEQLTPGMTYRFFGYPHDDPQWGPQFKFSSYTEEAPVDYSSICAYLQTCDKPERGSVTPRVAAILAEQYGSKAIETLVSDPAGCLATVIKFGPRTRWDLGKAKLAADYLKTKEGTRRAKVELMGLFSGRGFSKKLPDRLLKALGTNAAKMVRQNAFCLMKFRGCGFKLVDKLYCDLARIDSKTDAEYQAKLGAIYRQAACATYSVLCDRTGSTWVPYAGVASAVRTSIPHSLADADGAIAHAESQGVLKVSPDRKWVALTSKANAEATIARCICDMLEPGRSWPSVDTLDFGDDGEHQREELRKALTKRVGILRGSPGVGKTFVVGRLVAEIIRQHGESSVAIACPTGKAAVRATSSLSANGLSIVATTVHRLLVVENSEDGDWGFFYNASNPLPYRFLIVDESSMFDAGLMADLLAACSDDCHLLLTGDAEQLAPVGHGKPFSDLQQIVPVGSLTKIRRNSGRIVRACAEIRDTKRFTPSDEYDEANGENLPWLEVSDADQQDTILGLVQQIRDGGECDPLWGLQVLTACNDGSPVSRKVLNPMLQQLLNPSGARLPKNPFRVGDKVVCLSNGGYWLTADFMGWLARNKLGSRMLPDESQLFDLPGGMALRVTPPNNAVYVANGEVGQVIAIDEKKMIMRMSDPPREITVPWKVEDDRFGEAGDGENEAKGLVGDWDLAYVLSGHKSQGSQWPYVIVAIDSSGRARQVQSRNWIYTAISRAQKATFCVGKLQVALDACKTDGLAGRRTRLVELCRADRRVNDGSVRPADVERAELIQRLKGVVTNGTP